MFNIEIVYVDLSILKFSTMQLSRGLSQGINLMNHLINVQIIVIFQNEHYRFFLNDYVVKLIFLYFNQTSLNVNISM